MASITWEKEKVKDGEIKRLKNRGRIKFLIGGVLILSAVVYLIITSTLSGARYFITVDEIAADATYVGQTVRISGAVIGETINYDTSDPNSPKIEFTISHIPSDFDNLALALHESVNNPDMARIPVIVKDEALPDLLQHEAQAILTGYMDENGLFHADELLLKCPSRFEEAGPDQSIANDV